MIGKLATFIFKLKAKNRGEEGNFHPGQLHI